MRPEKGKRNNPAGSPSWTPPLRVVLSSCLAGQRVRYNGASKKEEALLPGLVEAARTLAASGSASFPEQREGGPQTTLPLFQEPAPPPAKKDDPPLVEFVTVCPETECGLPVPRPPMRLTVPLLRPRLLESASEREHTGRMQDCIREKLAFFATLPPDGAILKKGSPSCGLRGVPVYDGKKTAGRAPGLFAAAFARAFPFIPIVQEDDLRLPEARLAFVARMLAARSLRAGRTRRPVFHAGEDVYPL